MSTSVFIIHRHIYIYIYIDIYALQGMFLSLTTVIFDSPMAQTVWLGTGLAEGSVTVCAASKPGHTSPAGKP